MASHWVNIMSVEQWGRDPGLVTLNAVLQYNIHNIVFYDVVYILMKV